MKYALVFTLVAVVCLLEAVQIGGGGWLLLWPGLCYLGVALAYAGLGPWLLGKRRDGTLVPGAILCFLPYLLPTWALWHLQRLWLREPACQRIVPGLWLSRRLLPAEVPAEARMIVDMTAEFSEARQVRAGRDYLTLPTLDGHVPSVAGLRHLVERITSSTGDVLVHCALGHGRAAMVVACVLIKKGLARDVGEAERMLKEIRPRIGLNRAQRRRVAECCNGAAHV